MPYELVEEYEAVSQMARIDLSNLLPAHDFTPHYCAVKHDSNTTKCYAPHDLPNEAF